MPIAVQRYNAGMLCRSLLIVAVYAGLLLHAAADDLDAPFATLGELPQPTVAAFKYDLSLQSVAAQGYVMQGRINGVSTKANMLRFKADSPARIPGDGPMKFVSGRTTVGDGVIDFAATQESTARGMPEYSPDKPAAMFRCDVRRLPLVNDETKVRLRFKDVTHHYVLRYEDGKGLRLIPLNVAGGAHVDADSIREFSVVAASEAGTTWQCNAITIRATNGDNALWSTDVPMEGQPKSMRIVGDVLFVTTTAGHSFYIRKDTGEVAFYVKSIMPGDDPMKEVLALGRENMAIDNKGRSLARYITAAVVLNDRRAIPFLIDCIENGDGLPVKCMAIASLEKFNGNPDLWAPRDQKPGHNHLHWVGMKRVWPKPTQQAEIAKWREVFADELD